MSDQQGPETTDYSTTIRKVVASHSYSKSVLEVNQEFDQLDPGPIGDACSAWKRAADELTGLADSLRSQAADPLAEAWSSETSPDAQKQLRTAEATARALASDCMQMAHATDYAAQYAQWYKDNRPSVTDGVLTGLKGAVTGDGLTAGATAATQHLVNLLSRYNEVISILPGEVKARVVDSNSNTQGDFHVDPTGGGSGGGTAGVGGYGAGGSGAGSPLGSGSSAAGHIPGIGSTGAGTGGLGTDVGTGGLGTGGIGSGGLGSGGLGSGTTDGIGGSGVGDPYAAGTSLAGSGLGGGVSGFDPSTLGSGAGGLGSATSGLGAAGAGLGAGALGATGLGAGGLAGGLGAGRPGGLGGGAGSSLAGAGGAGTFGGPGMGGSAAGLSAQEAAAANAARGGNGMMPMHGAGGHGEGEEERERSTWLTEDDDVWGGGRDVPPPVISN